MSPTCDFWLRWTTITELFPRCFNEAATVVVLLLCVALPAHGAAYRFGPTAATAAEGSWSEECPVEIPTGGGRPRATPAARCDCTAFGEIRCRKPEVRCRPLKIRCRNLAAVPLFRRPRRGTSETWRSVYLAHQDITELPSAAFRHLRTGKLVLNFNRLGDRISARALSGLGTSLVELQLAGCSITSVPAGLLAGQERLERLHLWSNRLRHFPVGFFRAAPELRELLLWNNELAVLSADTLAGLWNLRHLDLDHNHIGELHKDAFTNLIELRLLRIAHNRVQSLHSETFVYASKLRALSLSHNTMEFVYERAFDGLANLLSLSLNDNRISYVPESLFSGLTNLTELLLHNNQLDFVWPRTFFGLSALQRLHLAGNHLKSLPDAALRQSPTLRYIDLESNEFETLNRCALPQSARSACTLSLVDNPVVCNCSLAWLGSDVIQEAERPLEVWGTCRWAAVTSRPVTPPSYGQPITSVVYEPSYQSMVGLARSCGEVQRIDCHFD